jgi:putative protein kinase ArgK-like GTPase of G3E family
MLIKKNMLNLTVFVVEKFDKECVIQNNETLQRVLELNNKYPNDSKILD